MIMYHGTSSKRGNEILKSGMIKKDALRIYGESHLMPTTDGYVYLTNDLINSVYYGNKTAWNDKDGEIYIFCISIDGSILEADKDEINYTLKPFGLDKEIKDINNPTLEESLKYVLSARVGQDIGLKKFKVKYTKVVSSLSLDCNEERNITREIVSLVRKDNEFANKYKKDFIDKLMWIEL